MAIRRAARSDHLLLAEATGKGEADDHCVIAGDPGLGKSSITHDIAARVSTGAPWPDGGHAPLGTVVLLSAEDGLADTVRPRCDALGADPSRIAVVTAIREGGNEHPFALDRDLPALERVIRETGAVVLVIDPLSAYLGKVDAHHQGTARACCGEHRGRRRVQPLVMPLVRQGLLRPCSQQVP